MSGLTKNVCVCVCGGGGEQTDKQTLLTTLYPCQHAQRNNYTHWELYGMQGAINSLLYINSPF